MIFMKVGCFPLKQGNAHVRCWPTVFSVALEAGGSMAQDLPGETLLFTYNLSLCVSLSDFFSLPLSDLFLSQNSSQYVSKTKINVN